MSSIRETAEKLVKERWVSVLTDVFWNEFTDAVEKALRNERERCATVALEQRCERDTAWDAACVAVATAIRGVEER